MAVLCRTGRQVGKEANRADDPISRDRCRTDGSPDDIRRQEALYKKQNEHFLKTIELSGNVHRWGPDSTNWRELYMHIELNKSFSLVPRLHLVVDFSKLRTLIGRYNTSIAKFAAVKFTAITNTSLLVCGMSHVSCLYQFMCLNPLPSPLRLLISPLLPPPKFPAKAKHSCKGIWKHILLFGSQVRLWCPPWNTPRSGCQGNKQAAVYASWSLRCLLQNSIVQIW